MMTYDHHVLSAVAPLRRKHPNLRPGGEMLHASPDVQAAVTMRRLRGDIRDDAEPQHIDGVVRASLWHLSMIYPRRPAPTAPRSTHPTLAGRQVCHRGMSAR